VAISPQANYTDLAIASAGETIGDICGEEVVALSAQRVPTVVNIGFLYRSRYYFFQIAPQLPSCG
jgi:hypothetical protein